MTGTFFIEWLRACLPRILAWSLTADEISAALGVVVGALWPRGSWADERSAGASFALCTAAAATAGLQAVFASSSCSLFSCRSCSCGDANSQKNAAIFAWCDSSGLSVGLRLGKGNRLRSTRLLFVLRRDSCPRQLACSVVAAFEVLIRILARALLAEARALLAKDVRRSFRLSARLARNDRTMLIGLAGRSFRGDNTMSRDGAPLCELTNRGRNRCRSGKFDASFGGRRGTTGRRTAKFLPPHPIGHAWHQTVL